MHATISIPDTIALSPEAPPAVPILNHASVAQAAQQPDLWAKLLFFLTDTRRQKNPVLSLRGKRLSADPYPHGLTTPPKKKLHWSGKSNTSTKQNLALVTSVHLNNTENRT